MHNNICQFLFALFNSVKISSDLNERRPLLDFPGFYKSRSGAPILLTESRGNYIRKRGRVCKYAARVPLAPQKTRVSVDNGTMAVTWTQH